MVMVLTGIGMPVAIIVYNHLLHAGLSYKWNTEEAA